jgi:ABC-type antimicrobial peptide transport system permease subunit
MVLKNLLRRKTRTFLTLLGIAIGVAAVVALGAIAEGFINSYSTILSSSGADIILAQGDAADILLSAVDENIAPQVASIYGVRRVAGALLGIIQMPDVPYFVVMGLDPNEFAMKHYRVVEGETIRGQRQVLLGRTAAKTFKKKIGDNYKLQEVSFKVVGIFETGSGMEEMGAVITLKEAQEIFKKPRQVAYYQLQVQRPDLIDPIIKELARRYPKLSASRSDDYMEGQQQTQMFRAMGWFIGLIAVVGGGLGMMNTMLMSVFERTREIGTLRALGWRRARVVRMILGEAFVLSILGGILGSILGIALTLWINQLPALIGMMDNAITPGLFVQAMIVALFLGAAGGIYPAMRAANLQPVEAMRYEGVGVKSAQSKFQFGGIALRNVFRQRTRTVLTTLAIGVGVGLVVTLGGMADGMVAQLGTMGSKSGELTITEAKASDMGLAAIDDRVGRWAAGLPDVEYVSGLLFGVAKIPGTPYFLVFGIEPTSFAIRHFAVTEGDRIRAPKEMILGRIAAKNLKKKVGDSLQLIDATYRVVGIYETGTGYEDAGGVIALSETQRAFKKPNQVSFFMLKLKDTSKADLVRAQIEARWSQVAVSKSTEFAEKTNDMQTFRSMASALSFLSILIGGVGIMNAMLMSVFERTREIGTLRALGWRRRRVVGMIVSESLALAFLSGIAGILLGVGLGNLIAMEPTMGAWLKGEYSLRLFAQAIGIALVLGGIGALYPAWRAANLSPIEALRYE